MSALQGIGAPLAAGITQGNLQGLQNVTGLQEAAKDRAIKQQIADTDQMKVQSDWLKPARDEAINLVRTRDLNRPAFLTGLQVQNLPDSEIQNRLSDYDGTTNMYRKLSMGSLSDFSAAANSGAIGPNTNHATAVIPGAGAGITSPPSQTAPPATPPVGTAAPAPAGPIVPSAPAASVPPTVPAPPTLTLPSPINRLGNGSAAPPPQQTDVSPAQMEQFRQAFQQTIGAPEILPAPAAPQQPRQAPTAAPSNTAPVQQPVQAAGPTGQQGTPATPQPQPPTGPTGPVSISADAGGNPILNVHGVGSTPLATAGQIKNEREVFPSVVSANKEIVEANNNISYLARLQNNGGTVSPEQWDKAYTALHVANSDLTAGYKQADDSIGKQFSIPSDQVTAYATAYKATAEGDKAAQDALATRLKTPGEIALASAQTGFTLAETKKTGVETAQLPKELELKRQEVHAKIMEASAALRNASTRVAEVQNQINQLGFERDKYLQQPGRELKQKYIDTQINNLWQDTMVRQTARGGFSVAGVGGISAGGGVGEKHKLLNVPAAMALMAEGLPSARIYLSAAAKQGTGAEGGSNMDVPDDQTQKGFIIAYHGKAAEDQALAAVKKDPAAYQAMRGMIQKGRAWLKTNPVNTSNNTPNPAPAPGDVGGNIKRALDAPFQNPTMQKIDRFFGFKPLAPLK